LFLECEGFCCWGCKTTLLLQIFLLVVVVVFVGGGGGGGALILFFVGLVFLWYVYICYEMPCTYS